MNEVAHIFESIDNLERGQLKNGFHYVKTHGKYHTYSWPSDAEQHYNRLKKKRK